MKTLEKINKENIKDLKFTLTDVLDSPEAKKMRAADLHRALILGNLLQNKVQIVFEDKYQKLYEVDTTVWAVGDRFITLKGGMHIPINAIHGIN
ncbi:hypothetical protein EL17_16735 [Anditalea andensis]|uniref:Uncharacterized protein n=2 Tax=Anditalea andensis TaxID=1048983 RepID=A0A074KR07_9BACT|nr:hypothetical protein EL17_16735 [Anditalea andensis]